MSYSKQVLSPRNPINPAASTPANPATTASLTLVMAGLAILYTPQKFNSLKVTVQVTLANATLADGGQVQISFGTGTAPVNAAALTGTQVGKPAQAISPAANNAYTVTAVAYITAVNVGTQYWFDLAYAAVTGGTLTASNIVFIIEEY